ncbi:MAG: tandem-95 repeat protein [Microcoleaceae cyanobacterium]
MANLLVTTLNNAGAGSLRQAILQADNNGEDDIITFDPSLDGQNIPLNSALGINVTGELFALTIDASALPNGITIDASPIDPTVAQRQAFNITTEVGATVSLIGLTMSSSGLDGVLHSGTGTLTIQNSSIINNGASGIRSTGGTLNLQSSTIEGNSLAGVNLINSSNGILSDNTIGNNGSAGISLSSSNSNQFISNFIGVDSTGTTANPNSQGISIANSSGNTLQDNVISGNQAQGIVISLSTQNTLLGNKIGTDLNGTIPIANGAEGILLEESTANIIGENDPAARNTISGNGAAGISLTQGSTSNTISGNNIGVNTVGDGAIGNADQGIQVINSPSNTFIANLISGNQSVGVLIAQSDQNTFQNNYIGVNEATDTALGNGGQGVSVDNSASTTLIGNVISGNQGNGIDLRNGTRQTTIQANSIGTDLTGTTAVPNVINGILIRSSTLNTIGGSGSGEANLISGNLSNGIVLEQSTENQILGNLIGTDETGSFAIGNGDRGIFLSANSDTNTIGGAGDASNIISGNGQDGIFIQNSGQNIITGNFVGTSILGSEAIANLAGITLEGAESNTIDNNFISGNTGTGLTLAANSSSNTITANQIGVDPSGTITVANRGNGIAINSSNANTLINNQISGNSDNGIELVGSSAVAAANVIQSNLIGIDRAGVQAIPNGRDGVRIAAGALDSMVGGTDPDTGNLIAFNLGSGVNILADEASTPIEHAVLGNRIFSNGSNSPGIGIDLGNNGVTANDPDDADTGPNNLQNFPELQAVVQRGNQITVEGTLNSTADTTFRVEFFGNRVADPSGNGQGEVFIAGIDVTTDATGSATIGQPVTLPLGASFVTATATDPTGNTSEFSSAIAINQAPIATPVNIATLINTPINLNLVDQSFDPDGTVDPATVDLDPATADIQSSLDVPGQGSFTVTPQGTLTFTPVIGFEGEITTPYTVQDNLGATSAPADLVVNVSRLVNQPPATSNVVASPAIPGDAVQAPLPALSATDADGSLTQFRITQLSQGGTLFLGNQAVTPGQLISVADAGNLTFTPNAGFSGFASFQYTALDDQGASDLTPATFTIPVTPVNQPPLTANIAGVIQPTNPPQPAPVSALNGSDSNGTVDNFRITQLPLNGALLLNGNPVDTTALIPVADAGNLSFTPNPGFVGIASFRYVAIDNEGIEDPTPALATLNVQPAANQPPETDNVQSPILNSATPQAALPTLSGSDSDGSVAEFRILTVPQNGQLALGATVLTADSLVPLAAAATLTYSPDSNSPSFSQETFTYAAIDDQGLEDSTPATYTIPVIGNIVPIANTVTAATVDSTAVDVALTPSPSGSDPDGSITQFTITQLPPVQAGELLIDDDADPATPSTLVTAGQNILLADIGNLRFTANPNFVGLTRFSYTVTDNQGAVSIPSQLEIPIQRTTLPNLPPIVGGITISPSLTDTTDLNPVTIPPLVGVDPEGEGLTFQILRVPNRGDLQLNGVSVINNQALTATEAEQLVYIPDPVANRDLFFRYTAIDPQGLQAPTDGRVTIPFLQNNNQAPFPENVSAPGILSTETNATLPALAAVDPEGDAIANFTLIKLPGQAEGELFLNGVSVAQGQSLTPTEAGELTFTPNLSFSGITVVEYTATDELGETSDEVGLLQIPVLPGNVNLPPTVSSITLSPPLENTVAAPVPVPVLQGSDPEGDPFAFTLLSLPSNGQLFLNGQAVLIDQQIALADAGNLSYDPDDSFVGTDAFRYTATDDQGVNAPNSALVSIPVQPGNQRPIVANRSSASIPNDSTGATVPTLFGTDPEDGTVALFQIVSLPNSGQLLLNGTEVAPGQQLTGTEAAQLTFVPNSNFIGNETFQYLAIDSQSLASRNSATVTLPTVASQNLPPIPADRIAPNVLNTQTNVALPALSATDPDGDVIQEFTLTQLPSSGQLLLSGQAVILDQVIPGTEAGNLTYTPVANFGGQVNFNYTATDAEGLESQVTATYTIPVILDNLPPIPGNPPLTFMRDTRVNVPLPPLVATDPDAGDSIAFFTVTSLPQTGQLLLGNAAVQLNQQILVDQAGQFTFTPDPNLGTSRTDRFSFTATDSRGAASLFAGTVDLSISPNLLPIAEPIIILPIPNTNVAFTLPPLMATDLDGTVVSFSLTELPTGQGTLFIGSTLVTSLTQVQNISPADAGTLAFAASPNFVGDFVLNYTALDNEEGISPLTPISITVFDTNSGIDTSVPPILIPSDDIEDLCDSPEVPDFEAIAIIIPAASTVADSFDSAILGTEANDVLVGTDSPDAVLGSGGNDTIDAAVGDDIVDGGADSDLIFGAVGNDTLIGDEGGAEGVIVGGADVISGEQGNDVISLNVGADTLYGGREDDFGYGGQDDDLMYGDRGNDTLFGDLGSDTLFGDQDVPNPTTLAGQDLLWGGAGDDFLNGNTNTDTLSGGAGADVVQGGQQNDLVFGEAGNDEVFGDLGDDTVVGNEGNDTLYGGTGTNEADLGQDKLCGGGGDDLLFAEAGQDIICGDGGNDTLYGGENSDTLIGGEGDDLLFGDQESDTLFGGEGADGFVLRADGSSDLVLDFGDGVDLLRLSGGLTFADLTITQGASGVLIQQETEVLMTVQGVTVGQMTTDDFTTV